MRTDKDGATVIRMIREGLDNVDQAISIFDSNLKLVFANKKLCTLLDLPLTFIEPGTDFEHFIRFNAERGEYGPGNVEQQVKERVETALEFKSHVLERQRPNGTVLRVSGAPLPGGGFASVYTDITAQRHQERRLQDQLLERTRDLQQSEENLRMISNEVPAGIAYLDADEIFRFGNRRFARFYGYHPDELIGRTAQAVLLGETYAISASKFSQAKMGHSVDFDALIPNQAGEALHVRTFLRPDKVGDGEVRGFYILSINITRHKQMAEALAHAEKMETVGRLSSGIAHDFNNLLTIILGNLTPLAKEIERDDLRNDMIAPSLRAARRGAAMTRQLLTVARRQPLDPQTVNVARIVSDTKALARPTLGQSVALDIAQVDPGVHVFVDAGQFENAILNLIVNARDAMKGKGKITVRARSTSLSRAEQALWQVNDAGPWVLMEIEDTGPGIDETMLPRIFDPFFTSRSSSGGTGLGLSTAQSFVEQSGGAVRVDNLQGCGACFSILLPRTETKPSAQETIQPADTVTKNFTGGLCLLVDDNEEVRTVVRRDLVDLGLGVIEANSAMDALNLIDSIDDIQLVLSDISMPGTMDGVDLGLQTRSRLPDLPVLLMTGQGTEVVDRAVDLLACPVLRKPFDKDQLAREISLAMKLEERPGI